MKTIRAHLWTATSIAFALGSAFAIDTATADAQQGTNAQGRTNETRKQAPPMKPGADGWYDASPPDGSFRARMPAEFAGFAEDNTTEAGAKTRTVGVRANVPAALGGLTTYVASCIEQQDDARTVKERLEAVSDRWVKLGGQLRYRREIAAGSAPAVGPGFEFELADDVKVIRARVYGTPRGTCTLLMTWRPYAKPTDPEIAKFFDSFAVARP